MGNPVTHRGKAKYLGGVGTKVTGISRRQFRPNLQKVHVSTANGTRKTRPGVHPVHSQRRRSIKRIRAAPFRLPRRRRRSRQRRARWPFPAKRSKRSLCWAGCCCPSGTRHHDQPDGRHSGLHGVAGRVGHRAGGADGPCRWTSPTCFATIGCGPAWIASEALANAPQARRRVLSGARSAWRVSRTVANRWGLLPGVGNITSALVKPPGMQLQGRFAESQGLLEMALIDLTATELLRQLSAAASVRSN